MRALALISFALLAACEIQPAPKKQPPPTPPTTESAKPVEPPPPPPAMADGGTGDGSAKIEITAPCLEVAAKVAQVFIDSATEPAQKSIYEQERANMTRKTGEACTTQGWSEDALKCYLATTTPAEIKACELKFPGRPPRPAPTGIPPANP